MIGLSYYKANKIIVENTPSELRNVVRARVFDIVQAEMESAEEIGKPLSKADQRDLWSKVCTIYIYRSDRGRATTI